MKSRDFVYENKKAKDVSLMDVATIAAKAFFADHIYTATVVH